MIQISNDSETNHLPETDFESEGFLEDDLRQWILGNTERLLDEEILLIGREVKIQNLGDGIDLLGIDKDGNGVIIELKRGKLPLDVSSQAIKYAAYVSEWEYEELKTQYNTFRDTEYGSQITPDETSFQQRLEQFCNDDYELNEDQRVIIVGEAAGKRPAFFIRWLIGKDVDAKIFEIQLYENGDDYTLRSQQIIPPMERQQPDVGPSSDGKPWKEDGKSWHYDEVCNPETAELLDAVITKLETKDNLGPVAWGQKQYIAFKNGRQNQVVIRTHQSKFHIDIHNAPIDIDAGSISDATGIPESNINSGDVLHSGRSGIRITCEPGYEVDFQELANRVAEAITFGNS